MVCHRGSSSVWIDCGELLSIAGSVTSVRWMCVFHFFWGKKRHKCVQECAFVYHFVDLCVSDMLMSSCVCGCLCAALGASCIRECCVYIYVYFCVYFGFVVGGCLSL